MPTPYERIRFDKEFFFHRQPLMRTENALVESDEEVFVERVCGPCGKIFKNYPSVDSPECFDCANSHNDFATIRFSMEVGCEDSKNPQRIREGTAGFNIGLRGIDKVVGTNADGTPKTEYRPVSNNELATARARREYAKQTGCTPQELQTKRAVGGR